MRNLLIIAGLLVCFNVSAQSKTTEELHKKYGEALSLFFYNNTLRMLNQNDDKDYDELIKNIEKLKFLMIDKAKTFKTEDYKKLVAGYKKESYEEIMTSRYQGKNFDVLLKDSDGKVEGTIVLVNDSTNLYILDIVGSVAMDKVTSLYKALGESSDIGSQIEKFTHQHDPKKKKNDKE